MSNEYQPVSGQKIAVQALADALGVPVSTQMPTTRPRRFVVVSRIGDGARVFGAMNPRFLIECYAENECEAELLAEKTRWCWCDFERTKPHGINSASADQNMVRYEDPSVEHHRFQFTGSLQILL